VPKLARNKIVPETEATNNVAQLVISNDELPKNLNPNSALRPYEMTKYFNYSQRTLGNYRTYYEQDQDIKVGPKWQRFGVKGIRYIVKDVLRCHAGLPWSEPYPVTFASVNPSKNKNNK